jgi:3',5'-cyclic AMP phosphodiesterase CpdA
VSNWEYCLRVIDREKPDLVVLSGDFVLDDPDRTDHHAFAKDQLDRINAPWAAIPGNHDVGDSTDAPYEGQAVNDERRKAFVTQYGKDWWEKDLHGWRIFGLNSMLAGSGLPAEEEQLNWLTERSSASSIPSIAFMHKPLCIEHLEETSNPGRTISPKSRISLVRALRSLNVRLVASGHHHCYNHVRSEGFDMVWCPTTCLVYPTRVSGIAKATGWLEYELADTSVCWHHHTEKDLKSVDISSILQKYPVRHATISELTNLQATSQEC